MDAGSRSNQTVAAAVSGQVVPDRPTTSTMLMTSFAVAHSFYETNFLQKLAYI